MVSVKGKWIWFLLLFELSSSINAIGDMLIENGDQPFFGSPTGIIGSGGDSLASLIQKKVDAKEPSNARVVRPPTGFNDFGFLSLRAQHDWHDDQRDKVTLYSCEGSINRYGRFVPKQTNHFPRDHKIKSRSAACEWHSSQKVEINEDIKLAPGVYLLGIGYYSFPGYIHVKKNRRTIVDLTSVTMGGDVESIDMNLGNEDAQKAYHFFYWNLYFYAYPSESQSISQCVRGKVPRWAGPACNLAVAEKGWEVYFTDYGAVENYNGGLNVYLVNPNGDQDNRKTYFLEYPQRVATFLAPDSTVNVLPGHYSFVFTRFDGKKKTRVDVALGLEGGTYDDLTKVYPHEGYDPLPNDWQPEIPDQYSFLDEIEPDPEPTPDDETNTFSGSKGREEGF